MRAPFHKAGQVASVLCALWSGAAMGDVVWTSSGRMEGKVAVHAGQVTCGEAKLEFAQAQRLIRDVAGRSISEGQALRLRDGEVWYGQVKRLVAKKIVFGSATLGEREVEVGKVAAVDFVNRPEKAGVEGERLYRDFGEAVPGKLLFMDPQRVTLQSPLGIVTLSRESALRYVFGEEKQAPKAAGDELRLIDGSIFRGKTSLGEGRVEMEHEILGKVILPIEAVAQITREGVLGLEVLGAKRIKGGYRIGAGEKGTITVPADGVLEAFVRPAEDSRAKMKVKVMREGQLVVEKNVREGFAVTERVKTGTGTVLILVEFDGPVVYPARVVVCDPVLVTGR